MAVRVYTPNGSRAKRSKSANRKRPMRSGVTRIPRVVSLGKQVLPRVLKNTLTYVEAYNISTNGSGWGQAIFRANGMYDPNISGSGHQPMYYDQLCALYNHWYVSGSRITIQLNYGATNAPFNCCLYVDDDGSVASTFYQAAERPGAVTNAFFVGSGVTYPVLKNKFNTKTWFGPQAQGSDNLHGSVVADPGEQADYVIIVDGGAGMVSSSVTFIVKIEYDVEWTELTTIATS